MSKPKVDDYLIDANGLPHLIVRMPENPLEYPFLVLVEVWPATPIEYVWADYRMFRHMEAGE